MFTAALQDSLSSVHMHLGFSGREAISVAVRCRDVRLGECLSCDHCREIVRL